MWDIATAIELAQVATEVADVIDRSEIRNGPSAYKAFDQSISVMIAETLKSTASILLADALATKSCFVNQLHALRQFERTYERVCLGQLLDLRYESFAKITERQYLRMIGFGTGGFLEGATSIGCTLSGAPPSVRGALRSYARFLGLAFQIYDDVLDLLPQPAHLKEFANDLKRHKQRLPLIHFLGNCPKTLKSRVRLAFRKRNMTDADAKGLIELMIRQGSLDYALKKANYFCARAVRCFTQSLSTSNRDMLIGLVELIRPDSDLLP